MISQIDFVPGDLVRVHEKIKEGDKSRIQIFEGTILALKGRGENKMYTVQKMVGEISVERIFAMKSPMVEKVEVAEARKKTTRAKLNYLKVRKK